MEKQKDNSSSSKDNQLPLNLFNNFPKETKVIKPTLIDDSKCYDILVSLLSVASFKGIGFRTVCQLYDTGFFDFFLEKTESELAQHPVFHTKRYAEFLQELTERKQELISHGHQLADNLKSQGITFIPDGHEGYPETLRRLSQKPRWLFVKGNPSVLKSSSIVAVVGTRTATNAGLDLASDCAKELAMRAIIVLSGFAHGIDEIAHRSATSYLGQSIAVLGHGIISGEQSLDRKLWGQIIENDGAILSEYLPFDTPNKESFLRRNELQAALSKMVIPVECPSPNSGTGATIRRAISLGTPIVCVVPSDIKEDSLLATREYLLSLKPQVKIAELTSIDFEQTLHQIIQKHDWEAAKKERQRRFFKRLRQQLLSAEERFRIKITYDEFARFNEEMSTMLNMTT